MDVAVSPQTSSSGFRRLSPLPDPYSKNVLQWARFFYALGLCVFPLVSGTKKPQVPWKEYQHSRPPWAQVELWFSGAANLAIVCGTVSGGFYVTDFEKETDARAFFPKLDKLAEQTPVVRTPHGGIHTYGQTLAVPRRSIRICEDPPIDLLGEGGYAVAPPSIVDGRKYQIIGSASQILWTAENPLPVLMKRCGQLGWKTREPEREPDTPAKGGLPLLGRDRILPEREKLRIIDALIPFWVRGRRNQLTIYLLGTFVKRGIREDDALDVISRICDLSADEEKEERVSQVPYHYHKPASVVPRLKGMSGLREILGAEKIG